jgi:ribonuclease Z
VDLDVVFLGTSASAPTARRGTSSLLVRHGGDRLLFDCGEGTQRQLLRSTIGLVDLEHIFLTHLHADHYLGLPGMLKTFSLRVREPPLTIYGPAGLRDLFAALGRVVGKLTYELELVELRPGDAVARDGYRVCAFPVQHGVPAVGYALVEDERPGRFDDAAADALGVPFGPERGRLQRGEPVELADGRVVRPEELVGEPRRGRTVVYTGDTAPTDAVALLFPGADVLVHEATFGDDDVERAAETGHSTARQAAEAASAAGVSLLALTHVSPRYYGPELLDQARAVFPATVLPRDFDTIEVPFPERGEPELVKAGARPERQPAAEREP